MTIQINTALPEGNFATTKDGMPTSVSAADIFDNKKVVLFSVPGAFTPTCSNDHLPGFVASASAFKQKGVDAIVCLSVNDVFVMDAWAKASGAQDAITMLADGNGTYTKALGLELDATGFGMGMRGQRFAIIADNRTVVSIFVEKDAGLDVSSAENVLKHL